MGPSASQSYPKRRELIRRLGRSHHHGQTMKPLSSASGERNGARRSRRTYSATCSSSSAWPRKSSIGAGMSALPDGSSRTCSATSGIRPSSGWPPPWTASSRARGGVRGQIHAAWSFSEEAAAEKHMAQVQHNMWVTNPRSCGALGDHRRRQMGGNRHPYRSALPAPPGDRGKEILALRGKRRGPSPLRRRTTAARIEAVRIVDMSSSNAWAEFASVFRRTREAYLEHENAQKANSRRSCRRTPGRRLGTGCGPNARDQAR